MKNFFVYAKTDESGGVYEGKGVLIGETTSLDKALELQSSRPSCAIFNEAGESYAPDGSWIKPGAWF